MTSRFLRSFPTDALLFGLVALGILSWTAQVSLFRLGILPFYEHILAYALFTLIVMAAKASLRIAIIEICILILSASGFETLKVFVSFRHPKTSDFFADVIGIATSLLLAIFGLSALKFITSLKRLMMQNYWRP